MAYSQLLESSMGLLGCRCPKSRTSYLRVQAPDPASRLIHMCSTLRSNGRGAEAERARETAGPTPRIAATARRVPNSLRHACLSGPPEVGAPRAARARGLPPARAVA